MRVIILVKWHYILSFYRVEGMELVSIQISVPSQIWKNSLAECAPFLVKRGLVILWARLPEANCAPMDHYLFIAFIVVRLDAVSLKISLGFDLLL